MHLSAAWQPHESGGYQTSFQMEPWQAEDLGSVGRILHRCSLQGTWLERSPPFSLGSGWAQKEPRGCSCRSSGGGGSLLGSLPLSARALSGYLIVPLSFGMDLSLQLTGPLLPHIPAATLAPSVPALAWLRQT